MTGTKLLHLIICTSIVNDTILTSGLLGTKATYSVVNYLAWCHNMMREEHLREEC